jgi:hypothetical protein
METLCSLLIGPQSNNSYCIVGRLNDLTQEERQLNGEHQFYRRNARLNMFFFLYDHLAKEMNKTLSKTVIDSDGVEKTGHHIRSKTYY